MRIDSMAFEAVCFALKEGFHQWSPYSASVHFSFDGCLWQWLGHSLPRGYFRGWDARVCVEPAPGHEPWCYKVGGMLVYANLKKSDLKYLKECEFAHIYVSIDSYRKGGRSWDEPINEERIPVQSIVYSGKTRRNKLVFSVSSKEEMEMVEKWIHSFDKTKYPGA